MPPAVGLTRALARYAVASGPEVLPEAVRHEAGRAFLNWMGVAIGGCEEPAPTLAARMVLGRQAQGRSTLIGQGATTDVASAAFVNCIASSVLAYDDAHLPTVAHPSGPAAAAVFAQAQARPVSGPAFLSAIALGIELQCRVANMLVRSPSPIDPNFYVNGFSGPIGVAAAVGRLRGLEEDRMTWAIGLAATQASGFRSTHGTMTAHFRPGHATQVGVVAALLAEQGFDCTFDALESSGGFIDVYAPGADPGEALDGLGRRHEMLENRYKPYPCGIVLHPVIDACREIRARLPIGAQIERVRLFVNPLVPRLTGKRNPRTPLESHVSVYHWAAVSLLADAPGLGATRASALDDPATLALADRIEVEAATEIGKGEARAEVVVAGGEAFAAHVVAARGSQARPMTDAELDAKFLELTVDRLGVDRAEGLRAACWRIPGASDVGAEIGALLP